MAPPTRMTAVAACTAVVALLATGIAVLLQAVPPTLLDRVRDICFGLVVAYLVPRAFPLWRSQLSVNDRAKLVAGTVAGGLLGFMVGTLVGFLVLPPNLSAPIQSDPVMALVAALVIAGGAAGAYRATLEVPFFGTLSDHSFHT